SGRSTWGLNHPSIDLVMKFDAIRKISIDGMSDSEREAITSFALNLAAITCWRRSNHSLTRLRKSSSTRSSSTIRFRLSRAKTAMFDASGRSLGDTPPAKDIPAPPQAPDPDKH